MTRRGAAGVGSNQYATRGTPTAPVGRAQSAETAAVASTGGPATTRRERLWHVGTFNPDDKSMFSYEGAGLSVSECPDAWVQIARIGGPTWHLDAPTGGGWFLRAHDLTDSERDDVIGWGVDHRLVERAVMWRAWSYDEESDSMRYMLCDSREDAETEVEELEDGSVEETPGLKPTAGLRERVKVHTDPADAFDHLLTVWCEDTRPDLDGIWWDDDFDPDAMSAPRGVILPGRVQQWTRST